MHPLSTPDWLRLRAWAWRLRLPLLALGLTLAVGTVLARLGPPPPPTVPVLVTARALPAGAEIGPGDVEVREVPAALVPDGLVARGTDLADLTAPVRTPSSVPASPVPARTPAPEQTAPGTSPPATPGPSLTAPVTGPPQTPAPGPTAPMTAPPQTPEQGPAPDEGVGSAPPLRDVGGTAGSVGPPTASGLIGRRLAVDLPAGLPLVPGLLVDPTATPPAGTVVVPVRFADPAIAALLAPGTRVDVVAAPSVDGAAPERVAQDALVLSGPGCTLDRTAAGAGTADGGTGGIGSDRGTGAGAGIGGSGVGGTAGDDGSTGGDDLSVDGTGAGARCDPQDGPVLLAVPPDTAVLLSGASASAVLAAVIVG